VQSTTEHTFNVDLANGDYTITITIGDQTYAHDNIDVYAEDLLVVDDVTAAAGSFREEMFAATVSDEQLNLRIRDDGGTDTNWAINGLTIQPGLPPPPPTEAYFDFGTDTSPLETGYKRVSNSTAYSSASGYGWTSTAGLQPRDRSAPDSLRRDLVQSATEHTFNADLANGDYTITITIGDQTYAHDNIDVYAETVLMIDNLDATAGTFMEIAFGVTITDTQLNLRILDDGGTDTNWAINGLTIQPGLPPPPTEAYFDFGTDTSPLETGYKRVSNSTAYSSASGYGWTSTNGLVSRDRGAPDKLRKDLVQGTTEHTFNVDLANGDYTITITIGDQDYMHDNIDVYAENTLVINDLTITASSFQEKTYEANVSDRQLNLRILDDGGTDLNWVLNAITIEPVPS
jgi:fibronectin type 3 domain-containing protein